MDKVKKVISVVIVFALVMGVTVIINSKLDNKQKGKCGVSLTWTLEDGILTISGIGKMYDYDMDSEKGMSPWMQNQEIKQVIVEEGVDSIGSYAFFNCQNLKSISFKDGLMSIGDYAFSCCSSLDGISFPSTLESIGAYAFERCSSITTIKIPNLVKEINEGTFFRCESLSNVSLSSTLQKIDAYAFMQCLKLRSVVIPNTVTTIETKAFSICSMLEELCVSSSVVEVDQTAFDLDYSLEVIGYEGSYMEQYATNHKLPFYIATEPFVDVPNGQWYSSIIKEAYDLGLMTGTTDITFGPLETVTRGMVATVLYRLVGSPEVEYEQFYNDLDESKYYAKAVTWLAKNGLIDSAQEKFNGSNGITRQDMCVMFRNLAQYLGFNTESELSLEQLYKDYADVKDYANQSVSWAIEGDLIQLSNNRIYPNGKATRADLAKITLGIYKIRNGE